MYGFYLYPNLGKNYKKQCLRQLGKLNTNWIFEEILREKICLGVIIMWSFFFFKRMFAFQRYAFLYEVM